MCLPDISVDESEQIPAILEPLTAGVRDAVLPPGSGAGSEELAAALAERTPAVMKLQVGAAAARQLAPAAQQGCRGPWPAARPLLPDRQLACLLLSPPNTAP
jgi:hypothetical protein